MLFVVLRRGEEEKKPGHYFENKRGKRSMHLLLIDDDVSVHQDVVEEEELTRFGLLATQFRQNAFADENASGRAERLGEKQKERLRSKYAQRRGSHFARAAERAFDARNATCIRFAVD